MTRNYLPALLWTCVFLDSAGAATSHVERGNLIFDNIPEASSDSVARLDAYLGARQATPFNWSPKGRLLMSTRFGDVEQLHTIETPGGARNQVTFAREPVLTAAYSPDPGRNAFVYLQEAAGGRAQLYYRRDARPTKLLTDGKALNGCPLWSNSGREVAFFSTVRDGVSYDIEIVDPEVMAPPRQVMSGDAAAWYPLDWSPDDRKLLVMKSVSLAERYLYVLDLDSGQKREVDPAPFKVGITAAKFSRDGQGVYVVSNRDSEFTKVRYVSLFTADRAVLSPPIAADVEDMALSRDGHYLAFVSNEGDTGKLNLTDLRSHQELTPPKLPSPGIIDHLSFDADGKRLAFSSTANDRPRDIFVLDAASNRVTAWTKSEIGAADGDTFVTPKLQQIPTFDRLDGHPRLLPAYVYQPTSSGPHAVLLLLHDGAAARYRPAFDPWIQYVVNELGFAVVAPNVRGSAGYGKTYGSLDNGMLRDDAVKDIGALLVWLGLQPEFDAKHVVVAGGYLALATLVNYSDRLSGGVDFAGIGDFISYLSNTAPDQQSQRRAEYGDERNPDMRVYLRRISPLTNADRISRPVLVVQGRNDLTVPASEADQMVNRLRSRGSEVWYLQVRDEGHTFRKQGNRDAYYAAFAQFLMKVGR